MKEFIGWMFLIGGGIASYKSDHALAMFFTTLGYICFMHADIDEIRKGMKL